VKKYEIEFETLKYDAPEHLFIGNFGRPGTGKTRLMATAPGLAVIPLQRKTRPTVEQVIRTEYPDRTVLWPKNSDELWKYKNPMELAMMNIEASKAFYRELVDKIKAAAWGLLEDKRCRTIGIDSGYALYQMIVAAHYGRSTRFSAEKTAWEPPNTEMRTFLESLSDKHLIFTTEAKESYEGKVALGYDEPAGYKQIGYDANVLVEHKFSVEDGFTLDVKMCQARAALQGEEGQACLTGEAITFQMLAMLIRPDSEPEEWE
jgi:hypothetical protein